MTRQDDKLTPVMKQYWDIKSKYPDILLFFHLGDFYEMFGEDAIKAAPILEIVLTQRTGLPMCGIPFRAATAYIKKAITKGFKVAICDQLEDPKTVKGIVKRGVTKIITPGTILEDTLLEAKKNNFISAIFVDNEPSLSAFACADISTGEFFVLSVSMDSIEAEFSKYNPGEIIISQRTADNKEIKSFLEKFKIPLSCVSDSYFEYENSKKIIAEVFDKNSEIKEKSMFCACGGLLNYIKEMQPQSIEIFSNITVLKTSDFMMLSSSAIKNLEIFKSSYNGSVQNSLFSVLDSTKTSMAARLLRQWLMNPLLDAVKIKNRQNIVKIFITNSSVRKEISDKLKNVSDIERIISRICSENAGPKELIALKVSLKIINEVSGILKTCENLNADIPSNQEVQDLISKTIVDEPPSVVKDGNVIKNAVNEELDEIKKISSDTKTFISELELQERKKSGIQNLKIGYTSVFGYYIEISKANARLAPANYTRKQTLTNAERYITEELKIFEEKILSSQEKILRLETSIFNSLRKEISIFAPAILKTSQIISEIDILLGFAQSALNFDYACPQITDGQELSITDGRHPVVEQILKNGEFTANDISFDNDKKIIILTGPNMGGKSTYLRQTALIVIMAQIGSFVPAREANIGIVDKIFTRIGAGDNLAGGESTFMVEMTETANILNQYTQRSLIILDEVGRGTSTFDGMSIAQSIIEFFTDERRKANEGVKVLFATHYFELTHLAGTLKGIVNFNVSVKEWNGEVIFLHKIVEGNADKSYGIHVAKLAGIPRQVIEKAYSVLDKLESSNAAILQKNSSQQELFSNSQPQILRELKSVDLNSLSPIAAFNLIKNWKEYYKDDTETHEKM